jgi:hypothetical protein
VVNAATLDLQKLAEDFGKASTNIGPAMNQFMDDAAAKILEQMRSTVPVRSGNLKNHLKITKSVDQWVIGPDGVDYAVFVEYGTRAHVIRPRKPGGVLAFQTAEGTVFTREVHHPGTRANPFAARAAQGFLDSLGADAAKVGVNQVIKP